MTFSFNLTVAKKNHAIFDFISEHAKKNNISIAEALIKLAGRGLQIQEPPEKEVATPSDPTSTTKDREILERASVNNTFLDLSEKGISAEDAYSHELVDKQDVIQHFQYLSSQLILIFGNDELSSSILQDPTLSGLVCSLRRTVINKIVMAAKI